MRRAAGHVVARMAGMEAYVTAGRCGPAGEDPADAQVAWYVAVTLAV